MLFVLFSPNRHTHYELKRWRTKQKKIDLWVLTIHAALHYYPNRFRMVDKVLGHCSHSVFDDSHLTTWPNALHFQFSVFKFPSNALFSADKLKINIKICSACLHRNDSNSTWINSNMRTFTQIALKITFTLCVPLAVNKILEKWKSKNQKRTHKMNQRNEASHGWISVRQ